MEWNSALAGRDEARPLPVHHSREQRTGRCGHRPLRRRSRLAVKRMAGAREETGERHAGLSCPTGESPGRDAPSWFPALAPERIEIIFRRGVYVAKNTSHEAKCRRPAFWRTSGTRAQCESPCRQAGRGSHAIVPPIQRMGGTGLSSLERSAFQRNQYIILLALDQMPIFSASRISSSRKSGCAMEIMASARSQVVRPFRFTLPYSVTT